MSVSRASDQERLREIGELLESTHGSAPLGNLADPLDELIFIQLSIRTREETYQNTFKGLREAVDGDWARLLEGPDETFLRILRRGGMARVKLDRLRGQIRMIVNRFGRADLRPLGEMATEEAEEFLLSLPGVGPKAARCVLMYSLDRAVFPVDSHCRRVMRRLGFLPGSIDRKAAHNHLQNIIPPPLRHSLHVNLVHHGRSICKPASPRCSICPLLDLCPTGARVTGAG